MLPQDVFDVAPEVLRHRLVLSYEALADGVTPDDIVGTGHRDGRGAPRRPEPGPHRGDCVSLRRPGAGPRPEPALRRLELTITRRLDGLLQGDHQGLVPGSGSEPGEGREYQPGDDVRRMDWNLTARTTVAHVRETIADRELETWVVVDQSPSLDFGTAACEKRDLALAATAAVGFLTAARGNRIGALLLRPGGLRDRAAALGPRRGHGRCSSGWRRLRACRTRASTAKAIAERGPAPT